MLHFVPALVSINAVTTRATTAHRYRTMTIQQTSLAILGRERTAIAARVTLAHFAVVLNELVLMWPREEVGSRAYLRWCPRWGRLTRQRIAARHVVQEPLFAQREEGPRQALPKLRVIHLGELLFPEILEALKDVDLNEAQHLCEMPTLP